MKTSAILLALALTGTLSLLATRAPGQGIAINIGSDLLATGTVLGNDTFSGNYRLNDGTTITAGTYTETHAFSGATFTDTVTYTSSTGATSTDTTATTRNADESKTVVYTHTDFGATAAFTATVTFPVVTMSVTTPHNTTNTSSGASPYGTGSYTAADGTTGTVGVFDTAGVISADLTSAAGGVTRVLHTEDTPLHRAIGTTNTVSPAGVLTRAILTRTASRRR